MFRPLPWQRPAPPPHVETFTVDPVAEKTEPVVLLETSFVVPSRLEAFALERSQPSQADVEMVLELEVAPRPDVLPPLVAKLVTSAADREDLLKDQALPPCYAVVERAGRAVARFHGAELAVRLAHLLSPWHAVVRIEDGRAMTDVAIPKGWTP